jgi:hypothetical protein
VPGTTVLGTSESPKSGIRRIVCPIGQRRGPDAFCSCPILKKTVKGDSP